MSEPKKDELGVFMQSLVRNNKQIRTDRAESIAEDTAIVYKRSVEDLELSVKKMKREQENMLDLSPIEIARTRYNHLFQGGN